MLDVSREEIVEGSLARALLVLAAPLLVQNLVQVAQQVIDLFWLGRLGADAVAAVGLNFPLVALLGVVAIGTLVGTQILVSQRVGADDLVAGRRAAVNGTILGFVLGLVVGLVTAVFAGEVIGLFDTTPRVGEMAATYLTVYALAMPIFSASDTLESGFVGWGDTRAALYINVLAIGTNAVLDPFLIFGWWLFPELGVAGAALATGIGYTGGLLLGIGMALRGRSGLLIDRSVLVFHTKDLREIVSIGWPNAAQSAASQAVRVVMIAIVTVAGGTAGVAAYTIGAQVATVSFVPATGLQHAAQSVIGQNLGAERPDRASRTTWIGVALAAGTLVLVGAVQWFVPETLTLVFVPDATGTELELTADYLQILAYGYWAIGATYLLRGGFNGARRTRTSLVATLLQYWAARLPIAAVGVYVLGAGVVGVFWAVTLSNIVAAIGLGLYYRHEVADGMYERAAEVASGEEGDDGERPDAETDGNGDEGTSAAAATDGSGAG
ncbi:MATE family efflux transporter [Saliphagus infecundisoli]|uniref:Multidrug-efflux transporter n=1 Tax=Saliphagus infecundisoli TaxID=1849069 RepID=A0ABD5QGT3_9EURY|nr:MATE family efflux transporter [Saliphagus infecundisoli]